MLINILLCVGICAIVFIIAIFTVATIRVLKSDYKSKFEQVKMGERVFAVKERNNKKEIIK